MNMPDMLVEIIDSKLFSSLKLDGGRKGGRLGLDHVIYKKARSEYIYILEGKDMRTLHLNDQTYLWYEIIS